MGVSRSSQGFCPEQWEDGENSKGEEHSARFYGGRNSGQVLGRPPKGGKGGHTEQVREIGPAPLSPKQGPLRGVSFFFRSMSILDQKTRKGGKRTLPYRLNGFSTRWAYLFRASLSWREQNNRERPGADPLFPVKLEGEPYESESNSVSVRRFGGFRAPRFKVIK